MILTGFRLMRFSPAVRSFSISSRCSAKQAASETMHQITKPGFMPWADFFGLRMRRRRLRLVGSITGALVSTGIAYSYFANLEVEVGKTFLGFEMIYMYGLGIIVAGFTGYLVGPSVADVIFKALLGKRALAFADADNLFLRHIARNRPNPAKVSATNPLTDYYGEKISSIHDYRRWLRESRLFKRRSEKFL